MDRSMSFERAASFYDRTRITDPEQLLAAVQLLDATLPSGRTLEIGVGTGALAEPLAGRGRWVAGVDISASMLARLRAKDPDREVGLAIADATRLPFADATFEGGYCRWVLHLIADWRDAVRELCRVVVRGGVVVVEPGGYSGAWREVWLRFIDELGAPAEPLGLDLRDGYVDLDAMFAECGARLRVIRDTPATFDSSLNRFFAETAARSYSWTWRVPRADLDRAIEVVRDWAIERYGSDMDAPFNPAAPHQWRVYDLAS